MRRTRPKHSQLTEAQRFKANARAYSNVLQERGVLVPVPCHCGSTRVQKHHEDYSDPRTVSWACRPCHLLDHGFITQERWRQLHDADLGAAKN